VTSTWQYKFFLSDNAVSALLTFLQILFTIVNKAVQSKVIEYTLKLLPTNVAKCRKLLKVDQEMFTKYACCVKCDEVYPLDDCVERIGSRNTSSKCSHIPNHPLGVDRHPCGALVMIKTVFFILPRLLFIELVCELCA